MTLYAFKGHRPRIHDSVFVAPTAQIIGDVVIEKGASVWFQTVVRGDMDRIRIGEGTNVQDLCMCHADKGVPLHIMDHVTIGHRCVIHGCTIEPHCLVGMGAVIMNRAVIGEGSVIAAGSVVLEDTVIPPGALVVGSPARIKKTYDHPEQMVEIIRAMADLYRDNGRTFLDQDAFIEIPG